MSLIMHGVFILLFLVTEVHLFEVVTVVPASRVGEGPCWKNGGIIGPTFTRTGNCTELDLRNLTITEPSKELFDRMADGLDRLRLCEIVADSVYLPAKLTEFIFYGTYERKTQIIIDGSSTYKLEKVFLKDVQQLPANFQLLRSLKDVTIHGVTERSYDISVFTQMLQLENITVRDSAGVTISHSVELPSLQKLDIVRSPLIISDGAMCKFPKLDHLDLDQIGLKEIPTCFSALSSLKRYRHMFDVLQRVNMDVFANMSQLTFLALDSNQISAITTQNRLELSHLRSIGLAENKLTELDVTQWIMPALENLSLSGNLLKQVDGLLQLQMQTTFKLLGMYDNPWNCEWLVETVMQMPSMEIFDKKGTCYAFSRINRSEEVNLLKYSLKLVNKTF